MAWPRAETAKRLYPPDGATLVSGPYPPGAPENAPDARAARRTTPPRARRLLDEAGLEGGAGRGPAQGRQEGLDRAALSDGPADLRRRLAEILRSAYEKVGVELVLRPLDWAAFSQRGAARASSTSSSLARVFLPPNLDPYPYYHSSQWPPGGQNIGFYKNAEADRVMEAARARDRRRASGSSSTGRCTACSPPTRRPTSCGAPTSTGRSPSGVDGVEVSPIGLFHFLPGPLGWRPRRRAAIAG